MDFSLYKKNLGIFNKIKNFPKLKDENNVLFKSRNGYRHYYSLESLEIEEAKPIFSYELNKIVGYCNDDMQGVFSKDDIYLMFDVSKQYNYINIMRYSSDKHEYVLHKQIRIIKFLNILLKKIPEINLKTKSEETLEYNNIIINSINRLIPEIEFYLSNKPKIEPDMLLVVSTHPYDFLSMSTGRRWTTCLDLDFRKNLYGEEFIEEMKDYDGICFYLIDKDDLNIKKPYARFSPTTNKYCTYLYSYGMYNKSLKKFVKDIYKKNYEI